MQHQAGGIVIWGT